MSASELSPELQAAVRLGVITTEEAIGNRMIRGALRSVSHELRTSEVTPRIVSVTSAEFVKMDLPERETLLSPWLPGQGLVMVHAERGIGKTHFALSCAYAVATGGRFLDFSAPEVRPVLYLDGEMPASAMQERLLQLHISNDGAKPMLELITPDLQPRDQGTINLSDPVYQQSLKPYVEAVSLIVVDNISTLVRGGKENESESWLAVQDWALQQRSEGRSVMFVHHSGKGGKQRGTSRREDVLDTVIRLNRPPDYSPEQGAVFELHYEKSRGFTGDDAKPIEAALTTDERGRQTWAYRPLEASTYERCCDLANEGLSPKEITLELGINKSNVSRHLAKGRRNGDIRN